MSTPTDLPATALPEPSTATSLLRRQIDDSAPPIWRLDAVAGISSNPKGAVGPRRPLRRAAIAIGVAAVLASAGLLLLGEFMTRPAARDIAHPPPDLGAATVRFQTARGTAVSGWLAKGMPGSGAVLLLHGIRGDRRQMLDRALALQRRGHAVLLIDLPAHGQSEGDRITFGLREAAAVTAALSFLHSAVPDERIGVIAVSLGAASFVLARPRPAPAAVVLESMYPTIAEAVAGRLAIRLGPLGPGLAPLLLWQLPLRLGVTEQQLRPIAAIAQIDSPVLIASGTQDLHTTWSQTERIFDAARAPKALWAVDGAAHVDLHAFDPEAYEDKVFEFLAKRLRGGA